MIEAFSNGVRHAGKGTREIWRHRQSGLEIDVDKKRKHHKGLSRLQKWSLGIAAGKKKRRA